MKSLLLALLFLLAVSTATAKCPTVSTVSEFNVTEYIRASWFIQEQQINGYQSQDDLYCVLATYNIDEHSKVPFFSGTVVSVYNYANKGAVNGPAEGAVNDTILCARVPDASVPSKLAVAPCFLPNFFAGSYWVLAAGPSPSHYEWAIVSGGEPTVEYPDGCTNPTKGSNGAGLWLFSRTPVADQETIDMMKTTLKGLGYTLSQLLPVTHQGCKYTQAFIKM